MSKGRGTCAATVCISLLFVVAATNGCAFGDRNVALKYTPVTKISARALPDVAVVKLADVRSREEVGEVRNGYGMKTATVWARNQDVGAWVANALCQELTGVGCRVEKYEDAPPPGADASVTGEVTEVYAKMFMSSRATVKADLCVQKAGVVVLNEEYTGKHSVLALTASTGEYEKVLQGALQDLMKKAVPEIVAALE